MKSRREIFKNPKSSDKIFITKKAKRIKKQVLFENSSTDEDSFVPDDSDSDCDLNDEILAYDLEKKYDCDEIREGDFILVECKGEKVKRYYVAKVIKRGNGEETEVKYLKKMQKSDTFVYSEEAETFVVGERDIILRLPKPVPITGSTKRVLAQLKFPVDFDGYVLG